MNLALQVGLDLAGAVTITVVTMRIVEALISKPRAAQPAAEVEASDEVAA